MAKNIGVRESWRLPHLGQRILKTAAAVFICLLIYYLRGYSGAGMPTESAITAIICMQPYVHDSRTYAFSRITGTLVGTFWGLSFLFLLLLFPSLGEHMPMVYAMMGLGVLVSLYTCVVLGKADASALAAIVFLCIVISFPDIEDPIHSTLQRIIDVFVGTAVALAVNLFRLPRVRQKDLLLFIRTKDLVPDRFAQLSSSALYRLNHLYEDGAWLSLISEHAPAFFTQQMSAAKVNIPLIVMDGAAIYDIGSGQFLDVQTIPEEASVRLRERLERLGVGYFIYTIHRNKTCIFHQGKLTIEEKLILDRLKRSPYRSYPEGESYDPDEVVYYKIVAREQELRKIESALLGALPRKRFRIATRVQSPEAGISALYIYAHSASPEQAQKRLLARLREQAPELRSEEIRLKSSYRSERDAIHLLTLVEKRYEPVRLPFRRKAKQ